MNQESVESKEGASLPGKHFCGECGSKNIDTTRKNYRFPYGVGNDVVELSCEVPMRSCTSCGFSFIDGEAEDLCHEAICRHLGVMNPAQIKTLRDLYKLTQAQFCEITKLGEATLSRWERGIVVQNRAYDNYLYLLSFRKNLNELLKRQEQDPAALTPVEENEPSFRVIKITEEIRRKQYEFELQPCLIAGE